MTNSAVSRWKPFVTVATVSFFTLFLLLSVPAQAARPSLSGLQNQVDAVEADVDAVQSQADQNSTAIADKQDRVTGVCPPEQAIAAINADGSVICEADTDTDTDTTYSAGEGLSLQGTTFSLDKRAAFRASGAAVSQNLILGVSTKLIFNAEEYDSGGNYSPADSAFVVPEDGFYRFDCSVESQTSLVSLATVIYLESNVSGLIDRKRRDGATSNSLVTLDVSANVFLSAGEIITCHFSYDGSNFQVYSYRGRFSRFSGFRIH